MNFPHTIFANQEGKSFRGRRWREGGTTSCPPSFSLRPPAAPYHSHQRRHANAKPWKKLRVSSTFHNINTYHHHHRLSACFCWSVSMHAAQHFLYFQSNSVTSVQLLIPKQICRSGTVCLFIGQSHFCSTVRSRVSS